MTDQKPRRITWVAKKLADPEFRRGFEQEWLSDQFLHDLEEVMKDHGVSRAQLAKRLGRSRASVTKSLRRGRNMTIKSMVELAEALDYRIDLSLRPRNKPRGIELQFHFEQPKAFRLLWHIDSLVSGLYVDRLFAGMRTQPNQQDSSDDIWNVEPPTVADAQTPETTWH